MSVHVYVTIYVKDRCQEWAQNDCRNFYKVKGLLTPYGDIDLGQRDCLVPDGIELLPESMLIYQ